MKGDRERCLAAGMDGYVAKPIQDWELWQAIRSVLSAERLAGPPGVPAARPEILDRDRVLARMGGKVSMLRKLAPVFRADCGRLTVEIGAALARKDARSAQRGAHTIKGMVSFFVATAATEAALALETLTGEADFRRAEETLTVLVAEIEKIQAELTLLCEGSESEALREERGATTTLGACP